MGKIISILFILLLFHLTSLVPEAFAAACESQDVRITYSPKFFFENDPTLTSGVTLNFQIDNANTLTNLNGKQVFLRFSQLGGTPFGPGQYYEESGMVTISGPSFSLTLPSDPNLINRGPHSGALHWIPDPGRIDNSPEYCQAVNYDIGVRSGRACTIDPGLPTQLPPGSRLPVIRFAGIANTRYILQTGLTTAGSLSATTDSGGQGIFRDVPIPGIAGEAVTISIAGTTVASAEPCQLPIHITPTAPPPPPPAASLGPIIPAPPGTGPGGARPGGSPAAAGGIPCDGGKGFQTAIGCIHTSPAEFTKDFLKFASAIGGGLAFLMMLLGAFQMLTSAGNPETLNAGRERFTSAIIGLLVVIFAVLLLQIIGLDILRLPGFNR